MFKDQETIDGVDLDIDHNDIEPLYLPQCTGLRRHVRIQAKRLMQAEGPKCRAEITFRKSNSVRLRWRSCKDLSNHKQK